VKKKNLERDPDKEWGVQGQNWGETWGFWNQGALTGGRGKDGPNLRGENNKKGEKLKRKLGKKEDR